ncbi:hypothetical protein GCM10020001_032270 [Nonomuraea salmonea]
MPPTDQRPAAASSAEAVDENETPQASAEPRSTEGSAAGGETPTVAGEREQGRERSRSAAGLEAAAGSPTVAGAPEAAEGQVIPLGRERRERKEAAAARPSEAPGREAAGGRSGAAGREAAGGRSGAAGRAGADERSGRAAGSSRPGREMAARLPRWDVTEPDDNEAGRRAADVPVPGPRGEGRVRRVESVVGRDSGGWRRIAQVVVGGGGVRTDGSELDEARARAVFGGSRRVVVLGCTGGAGQSTTALMLGHTFAQYRDDRVVAVDASTGGGTLTSKIEPETPETLTSLLSGLDRVSGYLTMRGYTTRTASGLEVISADTDAGAEQRLADRSFFSDRRIGESMRLLDRHYKLAVIDPAAALAARLLPYADQLVLVVPASEEAPEAVAMTYEWLDGHGCAELRRRAVMVVNGVSRRSMADVEQAESVARGRCRAIVRVPWEDDLAPGGAEVVDPGQLRAAGRRAYLALAGVVVAGFAAQTVRPSEEELASDPPGHENR